MRPRSVGFRHGVLATKLAIGLVAASSLARPAAAQTGRHSLFLGLDYAPAFTDPETVHDLGILFAWQLL